MLRLFLLGRLQKQKRNKKTREVKSNQMNKQIEVMKNSKRIDELEQDKQTLNKYVNTLYSVVDKLEQRIATLEKVLASHAKCIGEMREKKPCPTKKQ